MAVTATAEQVQESPDKCRLSVSWEADHGTQMEFEVELAEGATQRLLLDLVDDVGVEWVEPHA